MIPYRPVAPLSPGPRSGWRSVVAAVVMAALLGTTETSAVVADHESSASSVAAQTQGNSRRQFRRCPYFLVIS